MLVLLPQWLPAVYPTGERPSLAFQQSWQTKAGGAFSTRSGV